MESGRSLSNSWLPNRRRPNKAIVLDNCAMACGSFPAVLPLSLTNLGLIGVAEIPRYTGYGIPNNNYY